MKRYEIISITLIAFVFSGCGIYSKYSRPSEVTDDVDSIFRGAAAERVDSVRNIAALEWTDVFTDRYLQALVDSALVRNTDLRVARLRVSEAEASLKAAKLAYVPSFMFAPNGAVGSFDGGKGEYTYNIPITASWQIDIFGRLTNAKRRTKALVESSEAYRTAVRVKVIANVANLYYTLLMLDSQLDIAEQTADNWQRNVETMRSLKDAGVSNNAAVSQAEANYYTVKASVHDICEQIFIVENSLSALLCETPHHIERGRLEDCVMPDELYVGLPVQLLSNRPDVECAEKSLIQAFYATNEARASLYPSLSLSGSAGWTNEVGNVIINPGKLLVSAALSLLQPIFRNGALRAGLKIAMAQQEEAELAYRQTILNAGNEVNNALEQCQTAKRKQSLYEQRITSLETAAERTKLLMRHGSSTYLDVLIAEQTLLDARLGLVENNFKEIQGVIELYQSLGGGK